MGKFRHHSNFAKSAPATAYRFPFVCLGCRKSFKYPSSLQVKHCPQCKGEMVMLGRKFSAPKSKDTAQWEKINLLVAHGFRFYAVYEPSHWGGMRVVEYPNTLAEARLFVVKYASAVARQRPNHALLPEPGAAAVPKGDA
ncbi:hypothetical protein [Massilia glaciei]|uniref:Uncharacterized protein n=1 Tax=Massilia glaciei TaxID=1524097 RepID=A0A2U2I7T7_9BURK|nr:hypothetical protein [Massilia glaciei]PWF55779.1 hypothetical protein C7C56_000075 [Massilia glaciei]